MPVVPHVAFGWGGRITPVVRDSIPGDWQAHPLVPGQQVSALGCPGLSYTWRVWVGGRWPAPEPITLHGKTEPAHPIVHELHRRCLPHPEKFLVFGITARMGCPLEVRTETVLDLDPGVVVEHLIGIARAWETENRPGRPWTTRAEEVQASNLEAQAGLRRAMEEARKKREQEEKEKADAAKRRGGWTVRRGHHRPG